MNFTQTNNNAGDMNNVGLAARPATFNINAKATVRLTPFGLKVWTDKWAEIGYEPIRLRGGNILETELWDLMRTFGPHLFNGAREMPFVRNEIVIENR